MELRTIPQTSIDVTPVAMGCWPISGITSIDVTEKHSLATIEAAADSGINFFDTAYSYGFSGESEQMIARALGHRRDEINIATKGGIHWNGKQQGMDGRPATLRYECDESLLRLNTDRVELYYLHAPDPRIPIEDSAGVLKDLLDAGKILSIGVSNFNVEQLNRFAAVCPISAYQPHYNMLQRDIEKSQLPWCIEHDVAVMVYWPLMKGLLAGKLARDHVFDPKDGRQKYPMFQGEEWNKNHDFLDDLRPIAREAGMTLAQLVVNWTIQRPGITVALCGAKRPKQIRETAAAMTEQLTADQLAKIDRAIEHRGPVVSRGAV